LHLYKIISTKLIDSGFEDDLPNSNKVVEYQKEILEKLYSVKPDRIILNKREALYKSPMVF